MICCIRQSRVCIGQTKQEMSKPFGPSFNVHTFSSAPYPPQDPPGPHASQFSWSVAASSSTQPLSPAILSESNGILSPTPAVSRTRRPLRNKKRTKEELEITREAFERCVTCRSSVLFVSHRSPYLRFSARLAQDHIAVLQPDVDTPFIDHTDAVRRLLPFHIYQQPHEDLELLKRHKGKQKITNDDLKEELEGTCRLLFSERAANAFFSILFYRDAVCFGLS